MLSGQPRARFINPAAYLCYVCKEPTLLVWYVAGWMILMLDWQSGSTWLLAGLVWRMSWDVIFRPSSHASFGSRLAGALVKCLWACASGIFYAALSIGLVALFVMLLVGLTLLMSGRGNGRKRRRW